MQAKNILLYFFKLLLKKITRFIKKIINKRIFACYPLATLNFDDDKAFPIDLQPFITTHSGIPENHTKGFNIPLYLTHGLLPGAHCYAKEHSKDPELISLQSEIIHNIISGAERNHYNDLGGYLGDDPPKMPNFWKYNLQQLHIPEKLQEEFITRVTKITHKNRYKVCDYLFRLMRVCGRVYD